MFTDWLRFLINLTVIEFRISTNILQTWASIMIFLKLVLDDSMKANPYHLYLFVNINAVCPHNGYCHCLLILCFGLSYISYDRYIWFLLLWMDKYFIAFDEISSFIIIIIIVQERKNAYSTKAIRFQWILTWKSITCLTLNIFEFK